MATETQTPIEALRRAQIYNCHSADPEHCKLPICADARAALEDMVLLAALMQRIGYDEELSYLACPGPPNCDGSHYDTCPVALARTAVAKFTVKSSGDALDEERFAMLRGEVPAMNDLDSGVDAGQTHSDEPTGAEEREGMLKMVNATPPANQLEAKYGLWISRLCEEVRRLEAERNRLRELGKQLALTLHGHNVGDLQRCADHDACIDWRIERDFGN